jgi:hypothetical protein
LIDIEADATNKSITRSWLLNSQHLENDNGDAISGLVFDEQHSFVDEDESRAYICFQRRGDDTTPFSVQNIDIAPGSNVIVSTDGTIFEKSTDSSQGRRAFRHHMHILKGFVHHVEGVRVFVLSTEEDLCRIKAIVGRYIDANQKRANVECASRGLSFRLDKNTNSVGTSTLRWNLINFLTGDYAQADEKSQSSQGLSLKQRLPWLRDVIIRLKTPEFVDDSQFPLFNRFDPQISGCSFQEISKDFTILNEAQQKAVKKAISARDYALIQGYVTTFVLSFDLALFLTDKLHSLLRTAYREQAKPAQYPSWLGFLLLEGKEF